MALARAIASSQLLLLDEPFAALDTLLQAASCASIQGLATAVAHPHGHHQPRPEDVFSAGRPGPGHTRRPHRQDRGPAPEGRHLVTTCRAARPGHTRLGPVRQPGPCSDPMSSPHHRDGGFQNNDPGFEPKRLTDVLRWRLDAMRAEPLPRASSPILTTAADLSFIQANFGPAETRDMDRLRHRAGSGWAISLPTDPSSRSAPRCPSSAGASKRPAWPA